jgi:hypothetical protein
MDNVNNLIPRSETQHSNPASPQQQVDHVMYMIDNVVANFMPLPLQLNEMAPWLAHHSSIGIHLNLQLPSQNFDTRDEQSGFASGQSKKARARPRSLPSYQ